MSDLVLLVATLGVCVIIGLTMLWFVDRVAELIEEWRDRD
jgi:hypothetical protein